MDRISRHSVHGLIKRSTEAKINEHKVTEISSKVPTCFIGRGPITDEKGNAAVSGADALMSHIRVAL